jgi:hypothetical protein
MSPDYITALKGKFDDSTLAELRAYHVEKFGEAAPVKMNGPTIRTKLLRAEGLVNEFSGAKIGVFQAGNVPLFPDYNVSANGKWGGRRHRIVVSKPRDAVKGEHVLSISVNGSPPYHIKYGEVQAVPEPVYLRLKGLEVPVPTTKRNVFEDGAVETTTLLNLEEKYPISYKGVDPATANLAGSLTEWYQLKGTGWFRERTERDCQLIAERLEMVWRDEKKQALPHKQVLAQLVEFFFGHADADVPAAETAQAA